MTLGSLIFCWMPIGLVKIIARLCPVSLLSLKNGNVLRVHVCLGAMFKAHPLVTRDTEE